VTILVICTVTIAILVICTVTITILVICTVERSNTWIIVKPLPLSPASQPSTRSAFSLLSIEQVL
jgi:hypothetical protein